jgi:hypothetical protein
MVFSPSARPLVLHDASEEKQAFYLQRVITPILGIAITKIGLKVLKQRTIVFKLVALVVICLPCFGR